MRFRKTVRRLAPAVLALAVFAALAPATAGEESAKPTLKSIGELLVCQCGCNYGLNSCTHNNCSSDEEISAFIQKEISEGKDQPAILKALVGRYGVKVLASPPAEGFNLAAWILPGLALVMGLGVVTLAVRRLRRPPPTATAPPAPPVDPDLLAAIEEEMKQVADA
ncbi:MAG TPA: cytochrome c-type biogenesis protein CcmH [Terriglobia bacterium]|nr:cytochrome c-type biogenesis protein CcmH [Terriglobia bacterium]